MPVGWATAVKSIPRADSRASANCRSFTFSTKAASGSETKAASARRVATSPRASAGTQAPGSSTRNAVTAAATSRSIVAKASVAPAGAGRPSVLKSPERLVSMPSKKVFSRSGAATVLPTRL
jgi:hypothetical protein